jgi:hypothetical protein
MRIHPVACTACSTDCSALCCCVQSDESTEGGALLQDKASTKGGAAGMLPCATATTAGLVYAGIPGVLEFVVQTCMASNISWHS